MRGFSLIPRQFRGDADDAGEPGWLSRQVTGALQSVSLRACRHPIHTIVAIALLASTTYVGLLDGSLVESSNGAGAGQVDVASIVGGGRNLHLGQDTQWRWQVDNSAQVDTKKVTFFFFFLSLSFSLLLSLAISCHLLPVSFLFASFIWLTIC